MRIVVTLLLAANLGQGGIFILEDGEASRVPVCTFANRVGGSSTMMHAFKSSSGPFIIDSPPQPGIQCRQRCLNCRLLLSPRHLVRAAPPAPTHTEDTTVRPI